MAGAESEPGAIILRFTNCQALINGSLVWEDVWVRNGIVEDAQKLFYGDRIRETRVVDCGGGIVAPGFIDVQINGAFGVDFSSHERPEYAVSEVAKGLLKHGVTAFCPTVVTSSPASYRSILPRIRRRPGGREGAAILGVHVEGPYINAEKKGAHREVFIWHPDVPEAPVSFDNLMESYGDLSNVSIVTVAPEINGMCDVVNRLCRQNIVVSVGHSTANLTDAEQAVRSGARFITHLFNAMLPFHHRDPGIVGLLSTDQLPKDTQIFYGVIADGVHTHAAALHLAQHSNPGGIVLVSDAMAAAGLGTGLHRLGTLDVSITKNGHGQLEAHLADQPNTLAGSVAFQDECVQWLCKATRCTKAAALEAASLHPAQLLSMASKKGTLSPGADADIVVLNQDLDVQATYIGGQQVWLRDQNLLKFSTLNWGSWGHLQVCSWYFLILRTMWTLILCTCIGHILIYLSKK